MQAVILAGGLGMRLRPITETVPKPMVEVAGVPYLEHQIRMLARQEIRDIVMLTGYLGEQIETYFGSGSRLDVSMRYSKEPEPLGTAGALRLAEPLLREEFLVIYGDSYLPIDYRPILHLLNISGVTGVVTVYDNRLGDTSVKSNIALDSHQSITAYAKDSAASLPLEYVDAGVLAFRREIVNLIPPQQNVALEQEILPLLISRKALRGYITAQRFYDIGTLERIQSIEHYFAHDYHANAISN